MSILKRNAAGTWKFDSSLKVLKLSQVKELKHEEHFVNWKASVLDDVEEDFEFHFDSKAENEPMYYYSGRQGDNHYHLCIDEMDLDELYVRAVKEDEEGYFEFEWAK